MKFQICIPLAIILACLLSNSALAGGDYWNSLFSPAKCKLDGIGKYCCDDYCRKSFPCVSGVHCFTCDCYHRKCLPACVPMVSCFECDDYDRKCLPVIQCPPGDRLKCPPQKCNCRTTK